MSDAANHKSSAGPCLAEVAGDAPGDDATISEREKRRRFATRVVADTAALRCVADAFYDGWAAGGLGRGGPDEAEIAAAGFRVVALALATVERAADDAARAQWDPDNEGDR